MKIWKIVSGGLSVALSVILIYQSFFSGVWDAMAENGQFSGAAGIAVALLLAVGGIVSIATCGGSRSGAIAMAILFGTGGVVGLAAPGEPASLRVWAVWSLACAIAAMADIGTGGCDKKEDEAFRQWAAPVKPMRGPVTLNDVLAERDPRVRNAAVDALPEREAKNYLKQLLNVFVPRQQETDSDSGLVRTLIAILAVLAVFIVGVVALGIMFSALGGGGQNGPGPAAASASPAATLPLAESPSAQPSPAAEPTAAPSTPPAAGAGTLGNCYVEIKAAFLTQDTEGKPAIVITYEWTNNGPETTSAMAALAWKARQGSAQLVSAAISREPRYEPGTSGHSVRPGVTSEVQCAFVLEDETSTVVFELGVFGGASRETVSMRFSPDRLRRGQNPVDNTQ